MLQLGAKLLRWEKVDAKLIDQRFLEDGAYQSEMGGRTRYQVWEYMVELPDAGSGPKRLTIKEKTFWLGHPGPQVGDPVPVLVNAKRTKAVFDRKDPRLDQEASRKARLAAQRAEDEARFRAKLEGRD